MLNIDNYDIIAVYNNKQEQNIEVIKKAFKKDVLAFGLDGFGKKILSLLEHHENSTIIINDIDYYFSSRNKNNNTLRLFSFFKSMKRRNNKLVIVSSDPAFFNKSVLAWVNCFLTKTVFFGKLVNGTWVKNNLKLTHTETDGYIDSDKVLIVEHDKISFLE